MALVIIIFSNDAINPSTFENTPASDTKSSRQGNAQLVFTDESGSPWSNATVQYHQTSHDFLFGVGMTSPHGSVPLRLYEEFAQNGLNYALTFMPWGWLEPELGTYSWARIDDFSHIAAMKQLGYTLNGHAMIFFLPGHPENVPPYLLSTEFPQLKEAVYNHSFAVADHYRGTIAYWTINEPSWAYGDTFKMSREEWVEIVDAASQAIRKADPQARIMINMPPRDVPSINYFPIKFLERLQSQGIEFDAIGVELYPNFYDVNALDRNGYPKILSTSARLDQFARFNKPIILSEVGVPDLPSPQTQADWLRNFYTMAFEKPDVAGIAWYFVDDDPFLPGAGLFPSFDSPPRPVYQALADFIQDKTTTGTTRTDANGNARIEGYAGNYQVQASNSERTVSLSIHIAERQDSVFAVHINAQSQAAIVQLTPTPLPTPTPTPTITPTLTATSRPTATYTTTPMAPSTPAQVWNRPEVMVLFIVVIGLALGIFFITRRRK
jgi:GH35 family endo-1,4-beta-xylanase